MREENSDYIRLEKLDKCIEEIREMLNEISATAEEGDKDKERLIISRCLDDLIVEYMKHVKNI